MECHLLLILQKFVSEIQSRETYKLNCCISARKCFQKNFAIAWLSQNPEFQVRNALIKSKNLELSKLSLAFCFKNSDLSIYIKH